MKETLIKIKRKSKGKGNINQKETLLDKTNPFYDGNGRKCKISF